MPPYLHLPTHLALGLSLPTRIASRTSFLKSSLYSVANQYTRPISTTPHRYTDEMGLDDWKERAPYRIHENTDDFKVRYEASCHCGRVKYQLSREKPLDAKYCHCTTCQRLHGQSLHTPQACLPTADDASGAPFQWAAIFHKEDINFTHGHHDLGWYDSSEKTTRHKLPCKVSCAYCRAPIMDEGRNMILLFPTLIHFKGNEKDKANFAPRLAS